MDNKTVNEILKATKSKDPDVLGKAYARAVTISKYELAKSRDYVFPELVEKIIEQAHEALAEDKDKYSAFLNYHVIVSWINANRDFARCQHASLQRDIMVLKAYADRFYLAELMMNKDPAEDEESLAYTYSIDAYMKEIPAEPFSAVNYFNEGQETNQDMDYCYSWIVTYNTVISIAAKIHELPELEMELLDYNEDIATLRDIMATFNKTVSFINSRNIDDSVKHSRIDALRNFTSLVDIHGYDLEPSAEKIIEATAKIKDFTLFHDDYKVFSQMFDSINRMFEEEVFND